MTVAGPYTENEWIVMKHLRKQIPYMTKSPKYQGTPFLEEKKSKFKDLLTKQAA